jgi:hypothetical protein
MPLERVRFATLRPDRSLSNRHNRPAFEWFEQEIGYYPFFLAVGRSAAALAMTGYDDNWRIVAGREYPDGSYDIVHRKRGEFPNLVLFSFDDPDGTFMDYVSWHAALRAGIIGKKVTPREREKIFRPSWSRSRWIREAEDGNRQVQLGAPVLPLDHATAIGVRNRETGRFLHQMGFVEPRVLRIRV